MTLDIRVAWRTRPCAGEVVSGDIGVVIEGPGVIFAALLDALGHGWNAHNIAERASEELRAQRPSNPIEALYDLHTALRGHGGVCAAVATIDLVDGGLNFAGVGNVSGRQFGRNVTSLIPRSGVVGIRFGTPTRSSTRLEAGDRVLLYTDGISERAMTRIERLPYGATAAQIAEWVVENHSKPDDDASCLAVCCG